ncbi:MAG TPA: N-acetylmuramoyl-L-alanine amidase [Rhodobacteraceae bacterium]|nr:N-acetylmuramoyl-L-alanine amidase [Paracoccaceae bacterium]
MRRILFLLPLLWLALALPVQAQQPLGARATVTGAGLTLIERRGRVLVALDISQPVPWRVFTLEDPWRVVVDFSEIDWADTRPPAQIADITRVEEVATGTFRPGWSRLVIALTRPMAVAQAGMETTPGGARVSLRLTDTGAASFAATAGAPASAVFTEAETATLAPAPALTEDRLVVVLDPGHGGIDPGAEREGVRESELMLTFARALRDELRRASAEVEVVLTRDDDVFVPLEERLRIARHAGADVFVSLHADALAEGHASGAAVYTLAEDPTDAASAMLAERHDRADLLAGVDFSEIEDSVALMLMDLARTETAPRSERLADALVEGLFLATGSTYKTPRMHAAFSVLKAPDIPSVLVELGFLSSQVDRDRLTDPDWRARATAGLREALLGWAAEDASLARRLRR